MESYLTSTPAHFNTLTLADRLVSSVLTLCDCNVPERNTPRMNSDLTSLSSNPILEHLMRKAKPCQDQQRQANSANTALILRKDSSNVRDMAVSLLSSPVASDITNHSNNSYSALSDYVKSYSFSCLIMWQTYLYVTTLHLSLWQGNAGKASFTHQNMHIFALRFAAVV